MYMYMAMVGRAPPVEAILCIEIGDSFRVDQNQEETVQAASTASTNMEGLPYKLPFGVVFRVGIRCCAPVDRW